MRRRTELLGRMDRIGSDMRREPEPLSADSADRAIQQENDDVLVTIGQSAAEELIRLEAALHRLDENRYGICDSCGYHIETGRLLSVPYAQRCSRCAEFKVA
jgi:DnaK suppressor protein